MKRALSWLKNPTYVLAAVGLSGFAVDMFYRPISNAGLILLGVACAPWITRLVKSAKVAGFELELAPSARPEQTAARLAEEVAGPTDDGPFAGEVDSSARTVSSNEPEVPSPAGEGHDGPQPARAITGSGGLIFSPGQNLALAYLLEGLVLQELQEDLAGFLQRDVRMPSDRGREMVADGLIFRDGEVVAVEVKLFTQRPLRAALIQQAIDRMAIIPTRLRMLGYTNARVIVAVVTGEGVTPDQTRELEDRLSEVARVSVRFFQAERLLAKYGFASE